MPTLHLLPVPAFADNYIWLLADANNHALIVDPGDAAPVIAALTHANYTPTAILLTHHHADHIDGVPTLLERYPTLAVIAPHDERIPWATRHVSDGEQVRFETPAATFEVLAIPGHTLSHIAFYGEGVLLCGDTLFSVGCGRLFEGTPTQMLASLDRLAALPEDTRICCGHEYTLTNCLFAITIDATNAALIARLSAVRVQRAHGKPTLPSRLGDERATNPFLRIDTDTLRQTAARALDTAEPDRNACFAWLRQEKDRFQIAAT